MLLRSDLTRHARWSFFFTLRSKYNNGSLIIIWGIVHLDLFVPFERQRIGRLPTWASSVKAVRGREGRLTRAGTRRIPPCQWLDSSPSTSSSPAASHQWTHSPKSFSIPFITDSSKPKSSAQLFSGLAKQASRTEPTVHLSGGKPVYDPKAGDCTHASTGLVSSSEYSYRVYIFLLTVHEGRRV